MKKTILNILNIILILIYTTLSLICYAKGYIMSGLTFTILPFLWIAYAIFIDKTD